MSNQLSLMAQVIIQSEHKLTSLLRYFRNGKPNSKSKSSYLPDIKYLILFLYFKNKT